MDEPSMNIRARKADYETVRAAIDERRQEYNQRPARRAKVAVDESQPAACWIVRFLALMIMANFSDLAALSSQEPGAESRSTTRWTRGFRLLETEALPLISTRCLERTRPAVP